MIDIEKKGKAILELFPKNMRYHIKSDDYLERLVFAKSFQTQSIKAAFVTFGGGVFDIIRSSNLNYSNTDRLINFAGGLLLMTCFACLLDECVEKSREINCLEYILDLEDEQKEDAEKSKAL